MISSRRRAGGWDENIGRCSLRRSFSPVSRAVRVGVGGAAAPHNVRSDAVNVSEATQFEAAIEGAVAAGETDRAEALAGRYRAAAAGEPGGGEPERSLRFRAAYLAAQVALAAGRLGLALERSEPLLATKGLSPELASRLRLVAAEALARLRRPEEARACLRRVPPGLLSGEPTLHLRALRVRLWLGDVERLGDEIATCARELRRRGDGANCALLACEEGRAWDLLGDQARAETCWREADRLSRCSAAGVPDPIRADVLLQWGRLEHLRGHLQAALDRFEEALARAADAQSLELRLRLCLVLLDLNQGERARAQADAALRGTPADALPEEIRGLAHLVRRLLDDPASEASARGSAAREEPEPTVPVRRARRAVSLGTLALDAGARDDARRWLRRAEELARSHDLPEVLWRALQGLGRLAAEENDDRKAWQQFEEMVAVVESQARLLRRPADRAGYRQYHADVMRQLLLGACRRGDAEAVFRYQELDRGRLLLELWGGAPARRGGDRLLAAPELADLERRIDECERQLATAAGDAAEALHRRRQGLVAERDRVLDDVLRERAGGAGRGLPGLGDLRKALPAGSIYVAASAGEDDVFFLAASRDSAPEVIRAGIPARELSARQDGLRRCLNGQLERYRRGLRLGPDDRAELDGRLDDLGSTLAGLYRVLDARPGARLVWVPDGPLYGLPVHALRRGRYLIQDRDAVVTFGGALVVRQASAWRRAFVSWRPALAAAEVPEVLPEALREAHGVAAAFFRGRVLHGSGVTREAVRGWLPWASAVHFACHAHFDAEHPLAAGIQLPSGELWRALEWLDEPADGLPLVALSACSSGEAGAVFGREVFGLATGLLGGGVRAVLASLWPVADRETCPLMWGFYRHRLTNDLAAALALAQRDFVAAGVSPLFWAPFVLFGDPRALPAPSPWLRPWARWRQHLLDRTVSRLLVPFPPR